MKTNIKFILLSLSTALLIGCGEGASSSSSSSPASPATDEIQTVQNDMNTITKEKQPTSTEISYIDLFKMLDSNQQASMAVDAFGVEGLKVMCGNNEIKTGKYGMFTCTNLPFSVYLGDFKLGEISKVPNDRIIYTQDILHIPRAATMHPDVTKVSVLLQSLDEDGDLLNGIVISQESIDILNNGMANFHNLSEMSMDDVNTIVDDVITTRKADDADVKMKKVSAHNAQIALTEALASTPPKPADVMSYTSICE
jgi:hypothetical protein